MSWRKTQEKRGEEKTKRFSFRSMKSESIYVSFLFSPLFPRQRLIDENETLMQNQRGWKLTESVVRRPLRYSRKFFRALLRFFTCSKLNGPKTILLIYSSGLGTWRRGKKFISRETDPPSDKCMREKVLFARVSKLSFCIHEFVRKLNFCASSIHLRKFSPQWTFAFPSSIIGE